VSAHAAALPGARLLCYVILMPRSQRTAGRRREAARLRRLREALGFSQRELAAELKVAHGAIGLWESGARTIPGPVLKLMELFEDELGMRDDRAGGGARPLAALGTSSLSRGLRLSRTAAGATARAAAAAVARMLAGDERAGAIAAATQAAIARQIADTLGDMKGFAMKMGQMSSYLDFALPEPARDVLATLQRSTRPMAPRIVAQVFLEELGTSPRKLFAEWSPQPFAAASIGQVHRARLASGQPVAVKVQYPGVAAAIEADLRNAALVERFGAVFFRAQERGIFQAELRDRFLEECDYRLEAANQEAFRRLWGGRPGVVVPRVHPQLSSGRILVTDLIEGEEFRAFAARASPAEKDRAGELLHDFAFASIFRHAVFNGDPHPGNYLFTGGGAATGAAGGGPVAVVFLDFGCVKRLDARQVARWRAFLRATLERDVPRANGLWIEMGMVPDPSRYDFDHHQRMIHTIYEPWLLDRPFTFTPAYVARAWDVTGFHNRNRASMNVPRDWVFVHRLQSGLYALLAKLEATSAWRPRLLDLLYAPGEPRPAPFAAHEVAALGE
jgi:predicted unusual protein kinase regulating ubiquinone biosynthesis (AarF/ABC1/UbiB family)/DNA-binding XRE family transcriptional regulator